MEKLKAVIYKRSLIQNGQLNMISGGAFKSSIFNESKTGIPIIRIRDIMNDIWIFIKKIDSKYLMKLFPDKTIVFAMDGNFKISIWNGGKALLNQRVCRIRLESGLKMIEIHQIFICRNI